ncbi:hypothetical protein [Niveispirillum lacus]|uniref:hypothetical protein n=1 Tax=Niveispirillum lacus TaxID=1981099 RepID=UPI001054CB1E|nr:hypothetical protein [Niveispirillum lacus]
MLLLMLAVAGALSGLGISGAEAERARDGLSTNGNLRTTLTETAPLLLQDECPRARPDLSNGDPPPTKAITTGAYQVALVVSAPVVRGQFGPDLNRDRAGHAARMPTGPPTVRSV